MVPICRGRRIHRGFARRGQFVFAQMPDAFLPEPRPRRDLSLGPPGGVSGPDAKLWDEIEEGTGPELEQILAPRIPTINARGFESALEFARRQTDALYNATGLRVSVAYTMTFQQAIGGLGVRRGTCTDLDLMFDWTFVGRGTADTGRFIFTVEERFNVGPNPTNAVGGGVGGLTNTTGGFNDRGEVVRDAFYAQRLFYDRVRVLVGRMDISDYVGGYRLQNINSAFSNRAFFALAAAAFSGHGLGAVATVRPIDPLYVTFGAGNAYGCTTQIAVGRFFNDFDLFYTAEAGITREIQGLGLGRDAVTCWFVNERNDPEIGREQGFALVAEQDLGETFHAFARYLRADDVLERNKKSVQFGLGINGLLGSPRNFAAAAFSCGGPSTDGLRDEKVVEVFHRWQLTRFTQFSVGGQLIVDPGNVPEDSAVGVFIARFRVAF